MNSGIEAGSCEGQKPTAQMACANLTPSVGVFLRDDWGGPWERHHGVAVADVGPKLSSFEMPVTGSAPTSSASGLRSVNSHRLSPVAVAVLLEELMTCLGVFRLGAFWRVK
jgi:hypothetical protein